jgi:hypothetical protein
MSQATQQVNIIPVTTTEQQILPPVTSSSESDSVGPNKVTQAIAPIAPPRDPLNSSMREEPLLDESRHSSSGRPQIDVEMLLEFRNINRNIEFMIRNQFEEKERWNSVEQFIKGLTHLWVFQCNLM